MLTFFYDSGEPYSCSAWGSGGEPVGNLKLPLMVDDGDHNAAGLDQYFFGNDGFS